MSSDLVPMLAGVGLLSACCISSSFAASMMGGSGGSGGSGDSGGSPTPPAPPPNPFADWTVEEGIDYPYNDIFHYHPNSTTKASKEVCLTKCKEMSNCKLVTFNNDKTLCWGKSTAENKMEHGDRNNYFKP